MTQQERIALFTRDLTALMAEQEQDAMVIFNLPEDQDSFAQFSHANVDAPLFCEVSNRSEGWSAHSLDPQQVATLRSLGYEIPSPHHQANPRKEYTGDPSTLAQEVEQVFRDVFGAPEDYDIESSGVMW